MATVFDPTQDASWFGRISNLSGNTSTPEQINDDVLFLSAENLIVRQLPDAALPAGRNHPQREDISFALVYRTAYLYKTVGGTTGTRGETRTGSGAIKSTRRDYGEFSTTDSYDTGTSTSTANTVGTADQADNLYDLAEYYFGLLGISQTVSVDTDADFEVLLSK